MNKLPLLSSAEDKRLDLLRRFYYNSLPVYADKEEKDFVDKERRFKAIPYGGTSLINDIARLKKLIPKSGIPSFLDVGCGKGNVLNMANSLGFDITGIEFREKYRSCVPYNCFFKCMDAFDYKRYGKHDVIYYYVPIADGVKMTALTTIIVNQMKKGAFLYAIGHCPSRQDMDKLKEISYCIWQKV